VLFLKKRLKIMKMEPLPEFLTQVKGGASQTMLLYFIHCVRRSAGRVLAKEAPVLDRLLGVKASALGVVASA
jgi:hypothetical protein